MVSSFESFSFSSLLFTLSVTSFCTPVTHPLTPLLPCAVRAWWHRSLMTSPPGQGAASTMQGGARGVWPAQGLSVASVSRRPEGCEGRAWNWAPHPPCMTLQDRVDLSSGPHAPHCLFQGRSTQRGIQLACGRDGVCTLNGIWFFFLKGSWWIPQY